MVIRKFYFYYLAGYEVTNISPPSQIQNNVIAEGEEEGVEYEDVLVEV